MVDQATKKYVKDKLKQHRDYLEKIENQKKNNIQNAQDVAEAELAKRQKERREQALDQIE